MSGPLLVEDLIERVTGEAPERITRSMLARASGILAAVETGLAPDPGFSFIAPGRGDAVVLFNLGQGDPPPDAEKNEYQAALLRLTLGALAARADGRIDAAERRRLLDHVENTGGLSEAYKARLRADLDWLLVSPPELCTLKKHFAGLRNEEKAAVGRLLIAIAGAEGAIDASKVALIEKIFDVVGLPTETLYSELHALATSAPSDEPVTVQPASPGADGYAIPQPEAHERGTGKRQILLDRSRIAATMEETAKVSRALEAIFADEEPSGNKPTGSGDSNEILLGPDPKHDALVRELLTRSQWTSEEFAGLARHFGLMPEGALEAINEWACDATKGLLIEGEEILEINASVAQLLRAIETRPKP
jgi:tellurite resistance protein